jgi:predicted ATPase
MLTKLRIQNFKAWRNTGDLRLAPLTIFFGTNSSGKSSIGQFLMMLKQTAASPDRNRVLHPGDANSLVDLGTFDDLLHQHDQKNDLKFGIEWKQPGGLVIEDVLSQDKFRGETIRFSTTVGFENGKGIRAVCREFRYSFCGPSDSEFEAGMESKSDDIGKYDLVTKGFVDKRKKMRGWPLPHPSKFYGFPDETSLYYQNAETLNDLGFQFQSLLQSLSYLGPLREEPRRHYAWAGETPENVGSRGEHWVSAFLAATDRKINPAYKKRGLGFDALIATWLKELGLIHSFTIAPVAKGLREYRVRVKVTATSSEVSIPDVGFGVSQVLPVIVQSFYAPANSTVIIEQPELHLHPAVQQNLADLFVGAVQSRENGKDRNVQFLIESHSEHFLRRLQRRIAEEQISHEDVAVYFCEGTGSGNRAKPLEVDLYGNITNWPKDFFGDQMTDIAVMQKEGIRRRRAAKEATK